MDDHRQRQKGVENQVEGTLKEYEGKVRKGLGDLADDQSEELKGLGQQAKGKAQRKFGEIQEDLATDDDDLR